MIRIIVVMGVAGSGKSTIGALLAERWGAAFDDADGHHPKANVQKMAGGTPLTDEDRWPWLDIVGTAARRQADTAGRAVMACSALRRVYRERLMEAAGETILFVHLVGDRSLIASRMGGREGHFMPPALLDSQFATLEPPAADETALAVGNDQPPEAVVEAILGGLPQPA